MQFLTQHFACDQYHALLGSIETPCVFLRIFADYGAGWDDAAPVNNNLTEMTVATNIYFRQHHGISQLYEGMDLNLWEK